PLEGDVEIFDADREVRRLELFASVERDPVQALDDGHSLRVENLPDAANSLDVEAPCCFTRARTELDEDVHDETVAVRADGAADRNPVAFLDNGSGGSALDLGSAEVDGACSIGAAGHEVEVAEDVARLEDLLDTRQQGLDVVRRRSRLRAYVDADRQHERGDN